MSNVVEVYLVTRKIDGTTAYRSNGYKPTTMPNVAIMTDADSQRLAITAAFRDRMVRKLNSGDTFERYDCEFPDYKASKVRIRTEGED